MGYVSPLYSDGTGGFESVPAPPGALSFFRGRFDWVSNLKASMANRSYAFGFAVSGSGSGVGSLSPIFSAGRMITPTGMEAFSMFKSWLTVTN
jgi:hypothetical protein